VLEVLAVVGPIICLIDCLVIPIALIVLPLVGINHICHGIGDQLLAFLVLAICAPTLIPSFLKHRQKSVLALMVLGFSLIFFANFAGHAIDETLHLAMSVIGSILLIKAGADNRRFNKCACRHGKPAAVLVSVDSLEK
jgi:hypothetical protein